MYKSKQSYYDLFDEAGIKARKWILKEMEKNIIQTWRYKKNLKAIWNNIRRNVCIYWRWMSCIMGRYFRICLGQKEWKNWLPITNERIRQTYYGAIDIHTREFVLSAFDKANGDHTVASVKQLQELRDGKKLLLIWDRRLSPLFGYEKIFRRRNRGLEGKIGRLHAFYLNPMLQNKIQ